MARRKRGLQEINAGSMADIAFLLLIFFLVTTTINVDKGIKTMLPPWTDEPLDVDINARNILAVLVNSNNDLLVEGEPRQINELRQITYDFITNYGRNPDYSVSPTEAIVSLKNDRGTTYEIYLAVQNEIRAAYRQVRDEVAKREYNMTFTELEIKGEDKENPQWREYQKKEKAVKDIIPMRLSEAEPEDTGS